MANTKPKRLEMLELYILWNITNCCMLRVLLGSAELAKDPHKSGNELRINITVKVITSFAFVEF